MFKSIRGFGQALKRRMFGKAADCASNTASLTTSTAPARPAADDRCDWLVSTISKASNELPAALSVMSIGVETPPTLELPEVASDRAPLPQPAFGQTIPINSLEQPRLTVQIVGQTPDERERILTETVMGAARAYAEDTAQRELERLLMRRTFPGEDYEQGLARLIQSVQEGSLAAASNATKATIYERAVRQHAWKAELVEMSRWLKEIELLGLKPDTCAAAAARAANGDVEGALRYLEQDDSAASRSAYLGLLDRYKADEGLAEKYLLEGALDHLDRFTVDGWLAAVSKLIVKQRLPEVHELCRKFSDEQLDSRPHLRFLCGLAAALEAVPVERRPDFERVGAEVLFGNTLDSAEADSWCARALEQFDKVARQLESLDAPIMSRVVAGWVSAVRLSRASTRDSEIKAIKESMQDGRQAIALIPVVVALGLEVDTSALEAHLNRQEAFTGLTEEERLARVMLLFASKRWDELFDTIDRDWSSLIRVGQERSVASTAVASMAVDALIAREAFSSAQDFLDRRATEIGDTETARLRLLVTHKSGEDPTAAALAIYNETHGLADLNNVIVSLASTKQWGEAVRYSNQFFEREPNTLNALRHLDVMVRASSEPTDTYEFIEKAEPRISGSPEFSFRKAWALFQLGRTLQARAIAEEVCRQRDDVRDLLLDLHLAIQAGDWERFPQILQAARERIDDLDASGLLLMASVAGASDSHAAMELATRATELQPTDPAVLLGAYTLSVQLGRDDEGGHWLKRTFDNQGPDGPLQSYSFKQTIEILKASQDAWQQKFDDFRFARTPIHLAALRFNMPLTRLLVDIPRRNEELADARLRTPVPFRNGRRVALDCSTFKSAVFDITTIFQADQLGHLEEALGQFETVYVTSQIFRLLLEERQRVVFHQPSRIASAKAMLGRLGPGGLRTYSGLQTQGLPSDLPDEFASLLGGAVAESGVVVHDGPIYAMNSYMDKTVDLGDLSARVIAPGKLVRLLRDKGLLTGSEYLEAIRKLGGQAGESSEEPVDVSTIFVDNVSAEALERVGVLKLALAAYRKVYVYEPAVEQWRTLAEAELEVAPSLDAIERVRRTLRANLLSGKINLLPNAPDRPSSRIEGKAAFLMDVAANAGLADVLFIDDRQLNVLPEMVDLQQRKVAVACTVDLLDLLVTRGRLDEMLRDEGLHVWRKRCLYCIPISPTSLKRMLLSTSVGANHRIVETAHLRTIREYLARLISADALCTEDDLAYQNALWLDGTQVIKEIWLDMSVSVEVARAASSWVVQYVIPAVNVAVNGLNMSQERIEAVAGARCALMLQLGFDDIDREQSHNEWTSSEFFARLLPANGSVLDKMAAVVESSMLPILKEVADEMARNSHS